VLQLETLAQAGDIDLVLHNGDVSYADGDMSHWDTFMRKIQRVSSVVPYMTTVGNHEIWYNFSAYQKRWGQHMPQPNGTLSGGMFYGFDTMAAAGGGSVAAHFVGMNTEKVIDKAGMTDEQVGWIADDLQVHAWGGCRTVLCCCKAAAASCCAALHRATPHRAAFALLCLPPWCGNPPNNNLPNKLTNTRRSCVHGSRDGSVRHRARRSRRHTGASPTATGRCTPPAAAAAICPPAMPCCRRRWSAC
jgi:hypothetical protein